MSGALLWKTAVGSHNGHDQDGELALEGQLQLTPPYTLLPGEVGGVQTNMAAVDGVVYVPVDNLPETMTSVTQAVGTSDFFQGDWGDGRHRHRYRHAVMGNDPATAAAWWGDRGE